MRDLSKPARIDGIWCRSDRKFYYLESGAISVRNPVEKLRNMLIARGLIEFSTDTNWKNEEPYLLMNMQAAQDKNYDVQVVYINKHVKEMCETEQAPTPAKGNPWG